ncbi:MAG: DUF460 domain-containing protein [Desulfurococcales archaeon]|nr:DUF460 domain-containing protein [Desulfurococcales archaeon]
MTKTQPQRSKELYMGVDIEEGSPQSTTRRTLYSIVIVDAEGKIIEKQSKAPLSRLIRLAWYYKPRKIAFDNIMEIASNKKDLARILELFPAESEIVQVTIGKDKHYSISQLAAPYRDIVGYGKLTPGKTAYLVAILASKGYGASIRKIEKKTMILITKHRSPASGGYSQQRYQRKVRAAVLNATMRVKQALDEAGLEYDLKYRKSEGGLESATFTVYAPRERLIGIVRPHRGADYSVTIKPVYKTILSIPERSSKYLKPIIVGLDPGITTGIAVLDLNGRVVYLDSSKSFDRGSLLEAILEHGKPVIIAVDVPEPPESVRKIASLTGALLYTPPGELSIVEKRGLAQKALNGLLPEDSHQRDALAAAYKAYLSLRNKLGHVESQLRKIGISVDPSTVKEAVIKGVTIAEALEIAIEKELDKILSATKEKIEEKNYRTRIQQSQEDARGYQRLQLLEAELTYLRERVKQLQDENERLQEEMERRLASFKSSVYRDSLVSKMESQITILSKEIESLKDTINNLINEKRTIERILSKVYSGTYFLAYRVKSLTQSNAKNLISNPRSLMGEVLYLDNPVFEEALLYTLSSIKLLGIIVKGSPDIAILKKNAKRLFIPVVTEEELGIRPLYMTDEYVVLDAWVRDELSQMRKKLEEEHAQRISLERLISEYRKERSRTLGSQGKRITH